MPPWFKIQDQIIVRVSVSATLQAHKLLEQCGTGLTVDLRFWVKSAIDFLLTWFVLCI